MASGSSACTSFRLGMPTCDSLNYLRFIGPAITPELQAYFHFVLLAGAFASGTASLNRRSRDTVFNFVTIILGLEFEALGYATKINQLQSHKKTYSKEHHWNLLMVSKQWGFNLSQLVKGDDPFLQALIRSDHF